MADLVDQLEVILQESRHELETLSRTPEVRTLRSRLRSDAQKPDPDRLRRFAAEAGDQTPYYRNLSQEGGRYPVLSKQALRQNFAQLIRRDANGLIPGTNLTVIQTSGSTGVPCATLHCDEDSYWEYVILRRMYDALGLGDSFDTWDLGLRHSTDALIQPEAILTQGIQWNLPRLIESDPDLFSCYEAAFALSKPELIIGVSSLLVSLAQYCTRNSISVRPRVVVAGYEQLTTSAKAVIAEAFHAPVRLLYGTAEIGTCAWECNFGTLHFDDDVAKLEIVPDPNAQKHSGMGRMVVTSTLSTAMPMIRYDTGDLGIPTYDCACGRSEGMGITEISGRQADILIGRHGEDVSPYSILAALAAYGIPSFQIQQSSPGVAAIVTVDGVDGSALLNFLAQRVPGPIWSDISLHIEPTSQFIYTANGKRNPVAIQRRRCDESAV